VGRRGRGRGGGPGSIGRSVVWGGMVGVSEIRGNTPSNGVGRESEKSRAGERGGRGRQKAVGKNRVTRKGGGEECRGRRLSGIGKKGGRRRGESRGRGSEAWVGREVRHVRPLESKGGLEHKRHGQMVIRPSAAAGRGGLGGSTQRGGPLIKGSGGLKGTGLGGYVGVDRLEGDGGRGTTKGADRGSGGRGRGRQRKERGWGREGGGEGEGGKRGNKGTGVKEGVGSGARTGGGGEGRGG